MRSKFLCLKWCCFSLLFCFLISCSLTRELKKSEGESFPEKVSRLERLAFEAPSPSVKAKSHLQLAFIYVNCRNPQLSYSKALYEMERYLSLSPAEEPREESQNWLVILREIDSLSRDRIKIEKQNQNLQSQIDKLQGGLEKVRKANLYLRDEVVTLRETNTKMAETIERLKLLDWQMEKRRSLIK